MSRETITEKYALDYLRERFGADKVKLELLTGPDGRVTGHVFKVGRFKHVAGFHIETFALTLWADGVVYALAKKVAKPYRAKLEPLERNPWLK